LWRQLLILDISFDRSGVKNLTCGEYYINLINFFIIMRHTLQVYNI